MFFYNWPLKGAIMTGVLDITSGFDPGDDEIVVAILRKWAGGRLSTRFFTALAYILPTTVAETVILRQTGEKVEILLIPRPDDDPIWNGKVHSPGGALRRSDYEHEDPFQGIFRRIEAQELHTAFADPPLFVGCVTNLSERGPDVAHVFLASIVNEDTSPTGTIWVDVETLPTMDNFIHVQMKAITLAVGAFQKRQS